MNIANATAIENGMTKMNLKEAESIHLRHQMGNKMQMEDDNELKAETDELKESNANQATEFSELQQHLQEQHTSINNDMALADELSKSQEMGSKLQHAVENF